MKSKLIDTPFEVLANGLHVMNTRLIPRKGRLAASVEAMLTVLVIDVREHANAQLDARLACVLVFSSFFLLLLSQRFPPTILGVSRGGAASITLQHGAHLGVNEVLEAIPRDHISGQREI